MARKTCPSKMPTSCTAITFGCASRAMALASRRSRARPVCSQTVGVPLRSLSAILRSSSGSYAPYTTPIAPLPTRSMMR